MRHPERAFWCVVIFWAVILGLFWGITRVSADHQACNPGTLSFPRTWSVQPGVNSDPWQLAQRDINLHDTRRDWVLQVPWGQPSSYYVISSSSFWVQMSCASKTSVIHVSGDPSFIATWAAHETMHAAFFLGDHIYSSQYPAQGYMNPEYCDAPYEQLNPEYRGGMSYCDGPSKLFWDYTSTIWDDLDMMQALFP